jgi:putative SOS response-associated peptidase YedK
VIRRRDGELLGFAGLWEAWRDRETGEVIETCTVITTEPNRLMEPIHDRMPVIVAPADYNLWLDEAIQETERLMPLLRPYPDADLEAYTVCALVNSPRNNTPACLEPIENAS